MIDQTWYGPACSSPCCSALLFNFISCLMRVLLTLARIVRVHLQRYRRSQARIWQVTCSDHLRMSRFMTSPAAAKISPLYGTAMYGAMTSSTCGTMAGSRSAMLLQVLYVMAERYRCGITIAHAVKHLRYLVTTLEILVSASLSPRFRYLP